MMGVNPREYVRWFARILAVYGGWALSATAWRLVSLQCKAPQYPDACATATHRAELIAIGMLVVLAVLTFILAQIAARTGAAGGQ